MSSGRPLWTGLGTRLVAAQLLVAGALLAVAWIGSSRVQSAEQRVLWVYDHRVVPLNDIVQIADDFAIDFVDTVHKVADGTLSAGRGAETLQSVANSVDRDWREAERLTAQEGPRPMLSELRPLIEQALTSLTEARRLMLLGDAQGLRQWRVRELYGRVDPLTLRLHQVAARDLDATRAELLLLRGDLDSAVRDNTIALVLAGVFTVLVGLLAAIRFVASLRRIEQVVAAAARGNLSQRVQLAGRDELSQMALHVDLMIDSIEKSQRALTEQAAALVRSEAAARAAGEAKSMFLSGVSHELRTPLNVILGYAQVLGQDPSLSQPVKRGVSRMLEAGTHLLALIEDLLGISRLEAGMLKLNRKPLAPLAILSEIRDLLGSRARDKQLTLVLEKRSELPAWVHVDRRRLLQVLLNLVGNALKFSSQGEVRLSLSWQDERLEVEVEDGGPGIGAGELSQLFQQFSQGSAGRNAAEGAGLGLHISQHLVRAMGGEIRVESELGRGSRFWFSIDAPVCEPGSESSPLAERRVAPPDLALEPMLIVDDREANRDVLRALLESAGFATLELAGGQAALDHLARSAVSLLWLDLRMPDMDGRETLRRLRAREAEAGGHTRVVAITASAAEYDAEAASADGFDAYVPKPFRANVVFDTIERLLEIRLTHAEPEPSLAAQPYDLSKLSYASRSRLRELLLIGDARAAAELARAAGPEFSELALAISAFQIEPILATLSASLEDRDEHHDR